MNTYSSQGKDKNADSLQEKAKAFLTKHIKKNNYIVSSQDFENRKLREYLLVNNYLFSPLKGVYIIKDNKTPNALVVDQNYFPLLSKLGGTLGGLLLLDYYIGVSQKRKEILILTENMNGKSQIAESEYSITFKKSTSFREVHSVEINGSIFMTETKLSFIINQYNDYKDLKDFKFLVENTQIDFNELHRLISKGINVRSLSKLAFYYKSTNNIRNYTIIKNELAKTGKSLAYGVTTPDKNGDTLSYLFQKDTSDNENIKIIRFEEMYKNMASVLKNMSFDTKKEFGENDLKSLLSSIDMCMVYDTYHSLTIENYKVSMNDISILNAGEPENLKNEIENKLAIKGYLKAFNYIKDSIGYDYNQNIKITHTFIHNIAENIFFYFAKSKGFKIPAKYRTGPVQITQSQFIPPDPKYVDTLMDKFLDIINDYSITSQEDVLRKAILTHYLFVWIHPLPDGNGRTARFLMNYVLCTHGFNWKIISSDNKKQYIDALKQASEKNTIEDFARFIDKKD